MQPTIIAVVGASGSGKTYLSKLLQDELNVLVLSAIRHVPNGRTKRMERIIILSGISRFSRSAIC